MEGKQAEDQTLRALQERSASGLTEAIQSNIARTTAKWMSIGKIPESGKTSQIRKEDLNLVSHKRSLPVNDPMSDTEENKRAIKTARVAYMSDVKKSPLKNEKSAAVRPTVSAVKEMGLNSEYADNLNRITEATSKAHVSPSMFNLIREYVTMTKDPKGAQYLGLFNDKRSMQQHAVIFKDGFEMAKHYYADKIIGEFQQGQSEILGSVRGLVGKVNDIEADLQSLVSSVSKQANVQAAKEVEKVVENLGTQMSRQVNIHEPSISKAIRKVPEELVPILSQAIPLQVEQFKVEYASGASLKSLITKYRLQEILKSSGRSSRSSGSSKQL